MPMTATNNANPPSGRSEENTTDLQSQSNHLSPLFLMIRRPPRPPLFPYTPLFRSQIVNSFRDFRPEAAHAYDCDEQRKPAFRQRQDCRVHQLRSPRALLARESQPVGRNRRRYSALRFRIARNVVNSHPAIAKLYRVWHRSPAFVSCFFGINPQPLVLKRQAVGRNGGMDFVNRLPRPPGPA